MKLFPLLYRRIRFSTATCLPSLINYSFNTSWLKLDYTMFLKTRKFYCISTTFSDYFIGNLGIFGTTFDLTLKLNLVVWKFAT